MNGGLLLILLVGGVLELAIVFAPGRVGIVSVAVKVGASWLLAVAVLIAALQFLPVTPGYLPDHLE